MIGTIIALLVAVGVYLNAPAEQSLSLMEVALFLVTPAALFLLVPTIALFIASGSIQRSEHDLTSRIHELFRKDRSLTWMRRWLYIFPLLTYLGAMAFFFFPKINNPLFLAIWIVLFGIAMDVLYQTVKRVYGYLDPFYVTDLLKRRAVVSIQNEQELDLCQWSDALSEIGVKAVQRHSSSLAIHVCKHLQEIATLFLRSAKSISYQEKDPQSQAMGIKDKVSYTLFFLLQRLEMINDKAVKQHLEPVCSGTVTETGKIAIAAAKYDFSMMSFPVHFLGRFAMAAQTQGVPEVGSKAVCTLQEVAKQVLSEGETQYAELQEPFTTLVSQMNEISREMFHQDKTISPKLLIQPFRELRALFTSEKMAAHPDSANIIAGIDRVIGEFETLDTILRTLPSFTPTPEQSDQQKSAANAL